MLWEYEAILIIMLTEVFEDGVINCNQYWPEDNMELDYGQFIVERYNDSKFNNYTRREFMLYNRLCSFKKEVGNSTYMLKLKGSKWIKVSNIQPCPGQTRLPNPKWY